MKNIAIVAAISTMFLSCIKPDVCNERPSNEIEYYIDASPKKASFTRDFPMDIFGKNSVFEGQYLSIYLRGMNYSRSSMILTQDTAFTIFSTFIAEKGMQNMWALLEDCDVDTGGVTCPCKEDERSFEIKLTVVDTQQIWIDSVIFSQPSYFCVGCDTIRIELNNLESDEYTSTPLPNNIVNVRWGLGQHFTITPEYAATDLHLVNKHGPIDQYTFNFNSENTNNWAPGWHVSEYDRWRILVRH